MFAFAAKAFNLRDGSVGTAVYHVERVKFSSCSNDRVAGVGSLLATNVDSVIKGTI